MKFHLDIERGTGTGTGGLQSGRHRGKCTRSNQPPHMTALPWRPGSTTHATPPQQPVVHIFIIFLTINIENVVDKWVV